MKVATNAARLVNSIISGASKNKSATKANSSTSAGAGSGFEAKPAAAKGGCCGSGSQDAAKIAGLGTPAGQPSPEIQARQQEAAAGVKRGLDQATKQPSTGWLQSGGSFEDMAAQFDKDKMKNDSKEGKVGSGTGVNHSQTTQSPAAPQPASKPAAARKR